MKLSLHPPGTYACWVTSQSRGYFINHVTTDGIYCLYDSFTDKAQNYKFTDTDAKYSDYSIIFSIDELHNYTDLKLKYPEMFI